MEMATYLELCDLPDEVIADNIFCFLDHKSLARVSQTCRKLKACAYTEGNWKFFCQLYWLDNTKQRSQLSWRDNFIAWYDDLGRYMDVYVPIYRTWERILRRVESISPQIFYTLQVYPDERVEEVLNAIERRLTRPLPNDLRCSYRICNGQNLNFRQGFGQTKYGLLGVLSVYHYTVSEVLLSAESILENLIQANRESNVVDFTSRLIYLDGHYNVPGHPGFSRRICLNGNGDVPPGSVCIQLEEREIRIPSFLFADNFTRWLESLAVWLENPELMVEDGKISQFIHDPDCVAMTRHVKVSVATALVPEFSSLVRLHPKLMFAYQITMSMDDCTLPKFNCTLQTRHWEVSEYDVEGNQKTQVVDGPGVIGKHPTMAPGAYFRYASWTPLTSRKGFMEGSFGFRSNWDHCIFEVTCPRFDFHCPIIKNFIFQ